MIKIFLHLDQAIGEDTHLFHIILNFGKVMILGSIREKFLASRMVSGSNILSSHNLDKYICEFN
jgi:hypothetical protein